MDRRTALKTLGLLSAGRALPGCGEEARATIGERIDTVVVLMMENRSFDHAFGGMSLLEGRRELDGLDLLMANPRADGAPVRVRPAQLDCVPDPPHSWNASHRQWNAGRNDGFVREYEARQGLELAHHVMGYLVRAQQSASWTLADHYAVCARWFASVLSSTWPNRYYSLAAQSGGQRTNDPVEDPDMLSVFDLVRDAGRSYGVYYGNVGFSLILPRAYPRQYFQELPAFYEDAAAGALPNFTLIEPLYGRNDDHPPAHPVAGQVLIQSIYDALARSPQWSRSLFIVTYDEHGGFFDHVPPPLAPDERADRGFDQLGIRVPALVVGPWIRQRFVSHQRHDHTSILATVRELWGAPPLTLRDRAATSVLECVDPALLEAGRPRPAPALPTIHASEAELYAPECAEGLGLATGSLTGQLELERRFDVRADLAWADRRRHTDRTYEELLVHAEKRGLLVRRAGRV